MKFFENLKPKKLFKAKVPDLEQFIGRKVIIPGVLGAVTIHDIRGNFGMTIGHRKPKPVFYEINGKYLIGMLRFHAQMEGATDITEEQFREFENMEFEAEAFPKCRNTK